MFLLLPASSFLVSAIHKRVSSSSISDMNWTEHQRVLYGYKESKQWHFFPFLNKSVFKPRILTAQSPHVHISHRLLPCSSGTRCYSAKPRPVMNYWSTHYLEALWLQNNPLHLPIYLRKHRKGKRPINWKTTVQTLKILTFLLRGWKRKKK